MSASTTKKVRLDRFDRPPLRGFVHPASAFTPDGLELLTPDGSVSIIPWSQIKILSFVRDLDGEGVLADRRQFLARPKTAGLWAEFEFRDADRLEGILANDLLAVDGAGYTFSPPDVTRNTQRVFVPRAALERVTVLGVIGSPLRGRRLPQRSSESRQIRLFTEA